MTSSCISLGGDIFYYKNEEEEKEFISLFQTWHLWFPDYGLDLETREKNPWIPFTDEDKEDEWMHHHTGAALLYADWFPGQPNDGRPGNCARVRLNDKKSQASGLWWWDDSCEKNVG